MLRTIIAAIMLSGAAPAFAQGAEAGLPDPNDQSDTFTIAAGGAYIPDYEGSDESKFIPFGAIRGRVSGISFSTRGTYLYVDVLRRPDSGIDIDLGPIVGVRRERVKKVKDDFVDLFGKRKTAYELGGFVGVTFHGLTNAYDALSIRLDAVRDIGSAHESTVFTPNLEFGTPLSRRTYVAASLSADFVSNKYADYYYANPGAVLGSFAIPASNPGGGMKNWRLGALVNQSVTGDLTGGLSVFGAADYSRIVGDIGRTFFVDDRGSRSQWRLVAGLAYTF